MKLPLSRIAEFTSARGNFDRNSIAEAYSIDSRSIQRGQIFFAVKGERLDGHDYVEQALEKGAVAAVVNRDVSSRYPRTAPVLFVEDTLIALQSLATAA